MIITFPRLSPILLALLACATLPAQEVRSPDDALAVQLDLRDGELTYRVSHRGRPVLNESPLGLETSIGSFSTGLRADGESRQQIDERYTLPNGKQRDIHHRANQLTTRYRNSGGDVLEVLFRVSDRDVAFSYRLSSREHRRVVVQSERTGFALPAHATAFLSHQVAWGEGWMKTKPSYEEGYLMDVPVTRRSPSGLGFTFPALFRLGDAGWVYLTETGVSGNYVGSRLADPTPEGVYRIAFPEAAENAGIGDATAASSLPLHTPWRTLTFGDTLAPVVESTVVTDVVAPLYPASHTYRPGRASWSWLLWQDASMNERDQRAFVDLAATMGFEYILIDALWDANIGREKMARLVADARAKNVDVFLWYNSNGAWNDAPQSPRDRLNSAPARKREMAWLREIGVAGLKVDFFGGDKQTTIQLYEDILTDADTYGLVLNFHGATLPRGWERMYPNFMTSEAVTASENLVFSQGFADGEAWRATVLPFVRNPAGAMDYGPLLLNRRFSRDQTRGVIRRTTDAFQLATTVLFQSPLQHFGLTPNNLDEQPAHVLDFLKAVPAAWDEVRYVSGTPGDHVVLARRSGERWYIAAAHAGKDPRRLTINLPWLSGRDLTLIHDAEDLASGVRTVRVGDDGSVVLDLAVGGGALLFQ